MFWQDLVGRGLRSCKSIGCTETFNLYVGSGSTLALLKNKAPGTLPPPNLPFDVFDTAFHLSSLVFDFLVILEGVGK